MNVILLAEQMRRHSPYNYAFNNPIFFIDPDGMAPLANIGAGLNYDKDENDFTNPVMDAKSNRDPKSDPVLSSNSSGGGPEDGIPVANPSNPIELAEVVIQGESMGGVFINLQDRWAGSMASWQDFTGNKFSSNHTLADLQWYVSYGDAHRYYSQMQLNDLISAMHSGQINFIRGTYNLTASVLQNAGDGAMLLGYGLTLTGVGASVGVPMMTVGKGMSMVGGGMNAASSLVNGDYRGAAINGISIGLGGTGSAFINRSVLTPLSKSILDGNLNLKINAASRLINQ